MLRGITEAGAGRLFHWSQRDPNGWNQGDSGRGGEGCLDSRRNLEAAPPGLVDRLGVVYEDIEESSTTIYDLSYWVNDGATN